MNSVVSSVRVAPFRSASTRRGFVERTLSDQMLGALAILLLGTVIVALLRGRADWAALPWPVWLHLASVLPALALTPAVLSRSRGERGRRTLDRLWVGLLALAALDSFLIRPGTPGGFSWAHLLPVWTLAQLALIVEAARLRQHARHRARVRELVIGGLLTAGLLALASGGLPVAGVAGV